MPQSTDDPSIDEGVAPAPDSQETPGLESGPDTGTPANDSPEVDFEQRYNDLRPEFDRRSQQLSQLEKFQQAVSGQLGPEAQAEALKAYGVELEDDASDVDEYDDDPDSRLERLEATIEEQQQQAAAQQAAEAEAEFLSEGIESLEEQEGREFSDQEIAILASVARANPTNEGLPDLRLAHQHLAELQKGLQARWLESKKAQRRPGSGIAADKAVDLDNDEDRVQFMADRLAAAEQD
jgi:hypothetical protein